VFSATHPVSIFNAGQITFTAMSLLAPVLLIASILSLLEGRVRRLQGATPPRALAGLAAAIFLVMIVMGAVAISGFASQPARAGDASIDMKGTKFSTAKLESGQAVSIHLVNKDSFAHTFTIDGVVDSTIPASGATRVSFQLAPGTYRYYCAVPGHDQDMHGTLTVR
jgi:plastocyanin